MEPDNLIAYKIIKCCEEIKNIDKKWRRLPVPRGGRGGLGGRGVRGRVTGAKVKIMHFNHDPRQYLSIVIKN